jgi:hypothetical protein
MNVYIEPLIDKILKLWLGITICMPFVNQSGRRNLNSMEQLYAQFMMPRD